MAKKIWFYLISYYFSDFFVHAKHLKRLFPIRFLWWGCKDPNSVYLGASLGTCINNKYPSDSDASCPRTCFEKFCCKQHNCWVFSTREMCPGSPALITGKWTLNVVKACLKQWFSIPNAELNHIGKFFENTSFCNTSPEPLIELVWV